MKKLNYKQFLAHVKEHGITLARTTEERGEVPLGTKLYFNECDGEVSSWNDDIKSKNEQFNYDFHHSYWWHYNYEGLFELIEPESGTLTYGIGGMDLTDAIMYGTTTTRTNNDSNNLISKKTFMSKALRFIKDAALSADEKLLRKYDMKDGEGNYTSHFLAAIVELEATELGYKSESDMAVKLHCSVELGYSTFETHALSVKHLPTVLENLRTLAKEEK